MRVKYGPRWMFQQVKEAAGIHMSTYKESEVPKNAAIAEISREENQMLSGMKVPPDLQAIFARQT